MNGDADQHAMAVIRHRAPEVADLVLPVSLLANVLDVIAALEARLAALGEAVGAQARTQAHEDSRAA